jgi:hypothetical protein
MVELLQNQGMQSPSASTPAPPASAIPIAAAAASAPAHAASTTAITVTLVQPPQPSLFANGTVLVAAFAFAGVLFTIGAAHRRMLRELDVATTQANAERELTREQARIDREEAAAEAHKERIATTRRQVYLEAAEAIAKAQFFIASLPQLDLNTIDYPSNMGPLAISVNKVTVVGELETVKLSRELMKTVTLTFMLAMSDLLPMGQHKNELAFHSAQLEGAQLEVKRLLAAMQSHNESRNTDRAVFDALMISFNFHQKRCETEAAEIQLRHSRIALEQQKFSKFMLERTRELSTWLDLLADSVRREMCIPTDLAMFQALSIAMWESARDAQTQLMLKVESFQAGNTDAR